MNSYMLPDIIDICGEYIKDPGCVYKMVWCGDQDKKYYLVIMSKTSNTRTNEDTMERKRDVIDQNHASYRASELKVLFIINIHNPSDRPNSVSNTFNGRVSRYESEKHTAHYIVNLIVKPNRFDY